MFLVNNSSVLRLITNTTICYYNSRQLGLLQNITIHDIPVIAILDGCHNLRRLLLQFTTGISIHDIITIHDRARTGALVEIIIILFERKICKHVRCAFE